MHRAKSPSTPVGGGKGGVFRYLNTDLPTACPASLQGVCPLAQTAPAGRHLPRLRQVLQVLLIAPLTNGKMLRLFEKVSEFVEGKTILTVAMHACMLPHGALKGQSH
jgi:hypothetical protein